MLQLRMPLHLTISASLHQLHHSISPSDSMGGFILLLLRADAPQLQISLKSLGAKDSVMTYHRILFLYILY